MSDSSGRYAIVWAVNEHVYTHSDENGATITYGRAELDSLVGLEPQRIFSSLDDLAVVRRYPFVLHAVPVTDLNRLLGLDDTEEAS